jgi:hypothetical protein
MEDKYNGLLSIDEDDIFTSSPKKKFFDIVYTANRHLVEKEVDHMLLRFIALENLLAKEGYDLDKLEKIVDGEMMLDAEMEHKKNSLYIELVGKIVTQNE